MSSKTVPVVLHFVEVPALQRFKSGGLVRKAKQVRQAGRYGDQVLIHVNEDEFEELKRNWGEPTINPKTGLPEFFLKGLFKKIKKVARKILPIAAPALSILAPGLGTAVGSALGLSGNLASIAGNAIISGGAGALVGGGKGALTGALTGGLGAALQPTVSGFMTNNFPETSSMLGITAPAGPIGGASNVPGLAPSQMPGSPLTGVASAPSPAAFGGAGNDVLSGGFDMSSLPTGPGSATSVYNFPAGTALANPGVSPATAVAAAAPGADSNSFFSKLMSNPTSALLTGSALLSMLQGGYKPSKDDHDQGLINSPLKKLKFNRTATDYAGFDPTTYGQTGQSGFQGERQFFANNQLPDDGEAEDSEDAVDGKKKKTVTAKSGGAIKRARGGAMPAPTVVPTGRSDDVPAMLSDGEYVIDAETVAHLGDGSNESGAKKLDKFRESIRRHKGKILAKGQISPNAKSPMAYMREAARGRKTRAA